MSVLRFIITIILISITLIFISCSENPSNEVLIFEEEMTPSPKAEPMIETMEAIAEPDINSSDYIIISGTYANGDIPFDDIPFIRYTIDIPDDWTVERVEYGSFVEIYKPSDDEIYYKFSKNNTIHLYAVSSFLKSMIDYQFEEFELDTIDFEVNGYDVMLLINSYNNKYGYSFYITVDQSYCLIKGVSPENTEDQKEEFISIIETFRIVG
ncbi:MAG: hypothetical protein LBD23_17580 [Oscillospiraceae bacterium]|jgi:hypothetical protein|nr:hypothetical protein [Oscillospiraceae bacterium]